MGIDLRWQTKRPTKTRKLPFLPRFGFYLEIGGKALVYRQVPFLETLVYLAQVGPSIAAFVRVTKAQLAEVQFPGMSDLDPPPTITTSARDVTTR